MIKVLAAVYGSKRKAKDVTMICQHLVDHGNDDIPVNNVQMGGDPSPGDAKYFGITYEVDGVVDQRAAKEGETIDLVGP